MIYRLTTADKNKMLPEQAPIRQLTTLVVDRLMIVYLEAKCIRLNGVGTKNSIIRTACSFVRTIVDSGHPTY